MRFDVVFEGCSSMFEGLVKGVGEGEEKSKRRKEEKKEKEERKTH